MKCVLVVDDQSAVRRILRRSLERDGSFVVHEAEDGKQALAIASRLMPDLAIVDLSMPGMGGKELITRLSTIKPRPKIVVLSGHPDRSADAVRAGADLFLPKTTAGRSLLEALNVVLDVNGMQSATHLG